MAHLTGQLLCADPHPCMKSTAGVWRMSQGGAEGSAPCGDSSPEPLRRQPAVAAVLLPLSYAVYSPRVSILQKRVRGYQNTPAVRELGGREQTTVVAVADERLPLLAARPVGNRSTFAVRCIGFSSRQVGSTQYTGVPVGSYVKTGHCGMASQQARLEPASVTPANHLRITCPGYSACVRPF